MTEKDPKIVDLQRHRGKILQRQLQQKKYKPNKSGHKSGPPSTMPKWQVFLQLVLVLAMVAYAMSLCRIGS